MTQKSLMAKYATSQLLASYRGVQTRHGFTIDDVIKSGQLNPDSSIGIYAGDAESYTTFAQLFEPAIREYHGEQASGGHKSDFELPNAVTHLDPSSQYVISTRIRLARNLAAFPLPAAMRTQDRQRLEAQVVKALLGLTGELKGTYTPLRAITEQQQALLIKQHVLFKQHDRFHEAAGIFRDYPLGRGLFRSNNHAFSVWVGEEDNLRIISMESGSHVASVFARLCAGLKQLESSLDFAYSDRLGYLTSCPSNLGTGMRASVHIRLPKLSENQAQLRRIADRLNLSIRGSGGEHTTRSADGIIDISPHARLGLTESDIILQLHAGVKALISHEKRLKTASRTAAYQYHQETDPERLAVLLGSGAQVEGE